MPFGIGRRRAHALTMPEEEHAHAHGHASLFALGPSFAVDTAGLTMWFSFLVAFTLSAEIFLHRLHHYLGAPDSPGNQMLTKVSRSRRSRLICSGYSNFSAPPGPPSPHPLPSPYKRS